MAKVNPENDTVSDVSSNKHSTSFNLDGLTGRDSEYPMLLSDISTRMYLKMVLQWKIFYIFITFIIEMSATGSSTTGSGTHLITNGFCSFSPTSKRGKWIFMMQTVILSFTPIIILLVQNGMSFYDLMLEKQSILHKNELVSYIFSN